MSKAKVKKIKMPIGSKDEDLSEMFNQMLGTGTVNITIAYPRYKRIKGLCIQLVELFAQVANGPFFKHWPEFASQQQHIINFITRARTSISEIFRIDFADYEWNLTLLDDELKKKFSDVYADMKKSDIVKTFIVMCDRLVPYKRSFTDVADLRWQFLTTMAGTDWQPFPFTTLNLKYIFSLNINLACKQFFLTLLYKSFELSKKIYEEIQAPDIDVDQFVDFIMKNIDAIQKRPELSRCKDAFAKIKESVMLLKTNFSEYYRDFVSTSDNTIIMQHFITDVSKNTEASPRVTQQFRVIIQYYRKLAKEQINNPQIKMLFDRVNDSFKELEHGTENLVHIRPEDDLDVEIGDVDGESDVASVSVRPISMEELKVPAELSAALNKK